MTTQTIKYHYHAGSHTLAEHNEEISKLFDYLIMNGLEIVTYNEQLIDNSEIRFFCVAKKLNVL